ADSGCGVRRLGCAATTASTSPPCSPRPNPGAARGFGNARSCQTASTSACRCCRRAGSAKTIVKRLEEAIGNHDFATGRACSDEERRERDKLVLLYQRHGLDDWVFD